MDKVNEVSAELYNCFNFEIFLIMGIIDGFVKKHSFLSKEKIKIVELTNGNSYLAQHLEKNGYNYKENITKLNIDRFTEEIDVIKEGLEKSKPHIIVSMGLLQNLASDNKLGICDQRDWINFLAEYMNKKSIFIFLDIRNESCGVFKNVDTTYWDPTYIEKQLKDKIIKLKNINNIDGYVKTIMEATNVDIRSNPNKQLTMEDSGSLIGVSDVLINYLKEKHIVTIKPLEPKFIFEKGMFDKYMKDSWLSRFFKKDEEPKNSFYIHYKSVLLTLEKEDKEASFSDNIDFIIIFAILIVALVGSYIKSYSVDASSETFKMISYILPISGGYVVAKFLDMIRFYYSQHMDSK